MGKHKYTETVGKVGSYALLLGALTLPATVMSQTGDSEEGDDRTDVAPTPPAWGSPFDATGTAPVPGARGGFMNRMHQPGGYPARGHGPAMGYGPYASSSPGGSPFDNPAAPPPQPPRQQPPQEYGAGTGSPAGGGHHQGMMPRRGPFSGMGAEMTWSHGARKPFGGRGTMGFGADIGQLLQLPGLDDDQRGEIHDIKDKLRNRHWKLMDEEKDYSSELKGLYRAKRLDAKAIGAAYGKIFDIKRKMIESGILARQKAMDVLTDEQKEQVRGWGRPNS